MAETTVSQKRKDIGSRLKSERERLGYSDRQIAQLMGIPLNAYLECELGAADPGIYRLPRLAAVGFDVMYILTAERTSPIAEEAELLKRFRELSQRGQNSIFLTLDSLEKIAPNLRERVAKHFGRKDD